MINSLDPLSSRFLANLNRIQERSQRAERQISSGLRVEKASDAPEQVEQILRLRTRVDLNLQTQTNLARVESQVNVAESTMREAVTIVERARVLATQTATTGAPNRQAIADEVRQLHDRLISLAGASSEGRYVFGGDGATTAPYIADSSSPNGAALVSGSTTNSMVAVDENHTGFSVFRTASEIFDAPGSANVFKAMEDLAQALSADSESQVQTAVPGIRSALDHLNQQLAFFGGAQNRVTAALDSAKKNSVTLRAELSRLQETDLPAAILELNSAKVHHETALMAQSKTPRSTLFDYLG